MIRNVTIRGFKCFDDFSAPVHAMTLLAGVNGAGKSSFVQALLLAHLASNATTAFVPLNGAMQLRLGQALDVLRGGVMEIDLAHDTPGAQPARWRLGADADESLVLTIEGRPEIADTPVGLREGGLVYLNAERLGPRDVLGMDSAPVDQCNVGTQGEFTAHVISRHERKRVASERLHPSTSDETPHTFGVQLQLWMRDLVPSLELRTQAFPALNATSLQLKKAGLRTEWLRAPNLGFGVSYVLPIVVAGLLAPKDSLLVVENPEAHLHPSGQSCLARFLATIAACGVQVIVETHSDHVINGIRLAVADKHPLKAEDVSILFFQTDANGTRAESIGISARGSLTMSPVGFFDQADRDLAAIVRSRRHV